MTFPLLVLLSCNLAMIPLLVLNILDAGKKGWPFSLLGCLGISAMNVTFITGGLLK